MKKIFLSAGALLLSALFCAGCSGSSASQQPESASSQPGLHYSNLADTSSQKEISDLLESHGVSSVQADTLISWADDFNSRVTFGTLAEGFQPMTEAGADYQGLIIENKESGDGQIEPEANCRLTSYLLMKHLVEANGKSADNDTILLFDTEAIDTCAPFHLSDAERSRFISLFSWVPVHGTSTLEEHIERIQNAWKEREIRIDGDGISLITVYLHLPFDEVRFVGHTGVLLETEDGLLFVEKYGPQLPFQATKLADREELKRYLLSRADLYGDETELEPIIFENDHLLSL